MWSAPVQHFFANDPAYLDIPYIAKRTARFGSFANDLDSPDELACCKEGGAQQHFFDKNVLRKPLTIDRPIVIVRLIDDGQHQSIF